MENLIKVFVTVEVAGRSVTGENGNEQAPASRDKPVQKVHIVMHSTARSTVSPLLSMPELM